MPTTKKRGARPTSRPRKLNRQLPQISPTGADAESAFNTLINENGLLFNRLKLVAEQIHQQGEMSGARRAILRMLDEAGAQTVPQIGRARSVSRQHVQALINELTEEGYVEFVENPAHKRSPFTQLTARGKQFVQAMNRREHKLHEKMQLHLSDAEMLAAARSLRTLRAVFESEQWKRLAKSLK
jgi:DNA-binding MarR family transcriptional regulator